MGVLSPPDNTYINTSSPMTSHSPVVSYDVTLTSGKLVVLKQGINHKSDLMPSFL